MVEEELACELPLYKNDLIPILMRAMSHSGFKFSEMEMSEYYLFSFEIYNAIIFFVELVLSILLETFVFSPGTRKIFWAMSTLAQPVLADSNSSYPHLPLKVSFVKQ